jgi:hypothetical protein
MGWQARVALPPPFEAAPVLSAGASGAEASLFGSAAFGLLGCRQPCHRGCLASKRSALCATSTCSWTQAWASAIGSACSGRTIRPPLCRTNAPHDRLPSYSPRSTFGAFSIQSARFPGAACWPNGGSCMTTYADRSKCSTSRACRRRACRGGRQQRVGDAPQSGADCRGGKRNDRTVRNTLVWAEF